MVRNQQLDGRRSSESLIINGAYYNAIQGVHMGKSTQF